MPGHLGMYLVVHGIGVGVALAELAGPGHRTDSRAGAPVWAANGPGWL